jgi:hypothetical protein
MAKRVPFFVESRGGISVVTMADYFDRVCEMPETTILYDEDLVGNLWKNRFFLAAAHKQDRAKIFFVAYKEIMERLHSGHMYDIGEIVQTDYWEYIRAYHRGWQKEPLSRGARRQMGSKFFDGVNLFYDIKRNGMRNPLDILVEHGKCDLYRGNRRLVILKVLGIEKAKIRYAIAINKQNSPIEEILASQG